MSDPDRTVTDEDPGSSAPNWIMATVFRMRAVSRAADQALEKIQQVLAADEAMVEQLTKNQQILQQHLQSSALGGLIEDYMELLRQQKAGTLRDATGIGRTEQLLRQFLKDAEAVIRGARETVRGGSSSSSQPSQSSGQQSTDLGQAASQGKMRIGW